MVSNKREERACKISEAGAIGRGREDGSLNQ